MDDVLKPTDEFTDEDGKVHYVYGNAHYIVTRQFAEKGPTILELLEELLIRKLEEEQLL